MHDQFQLHIFTIPNKYVFFATTKYSSHIVSKRCNCLNFSILISEEKLLKLHIEILFIYCAPYLTFYKLTLCQTLLQKLNFTAETIFR